MDNPSAFQAIDAAVVACRRIAKKWFSGALKSTGNVSSTSSVNQTAAAFHRDTVKKRLKNREVSISLP